MITVSELQNIVNIKHPHILITNVQIVNQKSIASCECLLDGHIWDIPVGNLKYGSGCNACNNRVVVVGYNDLATTHSDLVKYFKNSSDAQTVTKASGKRFMMTCPDCGHYKEMSVSVLSDNGFKCPSCNDGYSYPNKFTLNLLKQLNVIFEPEKIFEWDKSKKYDFYIPHLSLVLEIMGSQHYEEWTKGKMSLKNIQTNDEYKKNMAIQNGLNYIAIDTRQTDLDYLKNSFINGDMSELFDLSTVDWESVAISSEKSNMITACELRNQGHHISEIGEMLFISRCTLQKYFKRGDKLGLCEYDPKEEMSKSSRLNGLKAGKLVNQYTLDGVFIAQHKSATEASKVLGNGKHAVKNYCIGRQKTAGNFHWEYA